jgi:GR25 family glycosyltransferase involved in LPS biosynthesis
MKGKAYVLNLRRRPDRLSRFQDFYNQFGPDLPLTIFEAIDGSKESEFDRVPEIIINKVSTENDYNNKASIRATAFSHMMLWKEIAESDFDYALIFEDDFYPRTPNDLLPEISSESLKTKWSKVINEYQNNLKERKNILFLGCGDLLPIHTVPPSEAMLIAQESSHVLKPHAGKYYGNPNFKSPYVFDWLGLGSYLISKQTAKYLLAIAKKQPIRTAADVWIKMLYIHDIVNICLTIPLFGYFPNILDSDTARPEPKLQ